MLRFARAGLICALALAPGLVWAGGNAPSSFGGGTPQYAYTVTTATNGQFSATFARAFSSTTPVLAAAPLAGSTAPQIAVCSIDSITNPTTAPVVAGHCSVTQAIAGGLSGNQNAVVALGSGISVMLSGADRTQ